MNTTVCLLANALYYPEGGGHLWVYSGKPVELFSYPYGDAGANPRVIEGALKPSRLARGPDTELQAELRQR